jgi:hypothetical protein
MLESPTSSPQPAANPPTSKVTQADIENCEEGGGNIGLTDEMGQGKHRPLPADCEDVWTLLCI